MLDTYDPTLAGPDQIMPWIAVDGSGGLNILYYDTTNHLLPDEFEDDCFLDAYYARIAGFATANETVTVARLTSPPPFHTDVPYEDNPDPAYEQFIGDYQQIAAASCKVYANYMTTQGEQRHYYTRAINVCPTDFDSSGGVDANDLVAFQSAYLSGDPRADMNHDTVINAADVAAFMAAYVTAPP